MHLPVGFVILGARGVAVDDERLVDYVRRARVGQVEGHDPVMRGDDATEVGPFSVRVEVDEEAGERVDASIV